LFGLVTVRMGRHWEDTDMIQSVLTRQASAVILTLMVVLMPLGSTAHALLFSETFLGAIEASIAAYSACRARGGTEEKCTPIALAIDPAGPQITRLQFAMQFDPSRIAINVPLSGFLCDFSSNGDCPPIAGSSGVIEGQPLNVGGPRPGTSFIFAVDPAAATVKLDYDLSANPATAVEERNAFAIGLDLLFPWSGTVALFDTPGPHDMSFTSFSCVATQDDIPAFCGSSNPSMGIDFGTVPEPTTLLLLGTTLAGLGLGGWRRRRHAEQPTQQA